MSTSTDQSQQAAPDLSGFAPTSIISDVEQSLLGFLGTPVQKALGALPLQQFGSQAPSANVSVPANQIDPLGIITPVVNSVGTLGTGQFSGVDPTQALNGISKAFDGNSMPVQQASSVAAEGWQGQSGTAANANTQAAPAHGADVANQADVGR